jgi:hypothetical protein
MQEHDPLVETGNTFKEAKKAKAELYARVEAARCMGAKVLLTLQQLEALRQARLFSQIGTQTDDRNAGLQERARRRSTAPARVGYAPT